MGWFWSERALITLVIPDGGEFQMTGVLIRFSNSCKNDKGNSNLFFNNELRKNEIHIHFSKWCENEKRKMKLISVFILGDPGADSGDEEKSKRAENYMARRKVKNGQKSPWGQCLTRPVPNGRRRSGFWLVHKNNRPETLLQTLMLSSLEKPILFEEANLLLGCKEMILITAKLKIMLSRSQFSQVSIRSNSLLFLRPFDFLPRPH